MSRFQNVTELHLQVAVTAPAYVIPQAQIDERVAARVGGKALALARMARAGIAVPPFVAVTTDAYEAYLDATGLRARILFELERKDFADMRWEEMWDAALRIRSLFLTTPLPEELRAALAQPLAARFAEVATVVRSSAPGEDSAGASFAGLHESYVNVRGVDAILEHVKLVWASLWSDAALLYRRELGLDPRRSVMAVVVQEIVAGERSGVAFSWHPDDDRRALVEAVHGLNQGLVDGVVEPDRWTLDRRDGAVLEHHAAERLEMMAAAADGVRLVPLPGDRRDAAPLAAGEVPRVFGLARRAEEHFAAPQDVEWTLRRDELFALQSRPITTLAGEAGDGRAAYLSLTPQLRQPAAPAAAHRGRGHPGARGRGRAPGGRRRSRAWTTPACARPCSERKAAHDRGVDVYVADFIPFAHGARLFGRAYNDVLRPDDPYEFTDLLTATPMLSLRRNAALERLAACLRDGDEDAAERALDDYLAEFGDAAVGGAPAAAATRRDEVLALARRLAARPAGRGAGATGPGGARAALHRGAPRGGARARGRAARAGSRELAPARRRQPVPRPPRAAAHGGARRGAAPRPAGRRQPATARGHAAVAAGRSRRRRAAEPQAGAGRRPAAPAGVRRQARQIVGQPAGPGLAVGAARVVAGREDLAAFADGEILVCDAIEPEMTFVVPLAAGIVERRGGMLIHGAIIAREYGLPCVTGVPRATELIRTGDRAHRRRLPRHRRHRLSNARSPCRGPAARLESCASACSVLGGGGHDSARDLGGSARRPVAAALCAAPPLVGCGTSGSGSTDAGTTPPSGDASASPPPPATATVGDEISDTTAPTPRPPSTAPRSNAVWRCRASPTWAKLTAKARRRPSAPWPSSTPRPTRWPSGRASAATSGVSRWPPTAG